MNIKILNPIDCRSWDRQIAGLQGSNFFYTSNWARVLCDSYGYRPRYFCCFQNDRITDLIPVMEINSPFTGKRGVSLPFSDQVDPLVHDQNRFEQILGEVISYGRKNGWKTIDFHGGKSFFDIADSYQSFISHCIDLNCSQPDVSKGFRNSTRRNILKAQKLGVKTKISLSPDSLAEFIRLNCLTRKVHGLPPQPDYFFKNIHKNIVSENKGFTCLAHYQDKVIAGVVFFISNQQAIYKYGASDKRYLHLRPNNLAMADGIKWALKQGVRSIDLGRTEKANEGQIQFKKGWNASTSDLFYYKIDIPTGKLLSDRMIIRSSYSLFKKLPIPILKKIGNFAYRHIA